MRSTARSRWTPAAKQYRLQDEIATLLVRPRGWHLHESHLLVDGDPVSASLFDFGLYLFHCGQRQLDAGSGPYFYLPKLESHLEARLWNDVFVFAQEQLGIPRGTIRATVLIETILAAFEMDEILYELREHSAGLNAGRWDYMFSIIKKFSDRPEFVLPDRPLVTMSVPFMRAYTELLVKTCHRRGAHAIGGMAAFIPSRRDPEVNEIALTKVREDKLREAGDGFDGTWVAHPDLVPIAMGVFDDVLGERPNQVDRQRDDVSVAAADLLDVAATPGDVTEEGVRLNVSVGIQYIASWLNGVGAAAINNLMEDAATAEISRSQIWQWVRHGRISRERVLELEREELEKLGPGYEAAAEIFAEVALADEFTEFLTLPAYERLVRRLGFLSADSCQRVAHLRAERRRPAVGADVHGGMPAANADLTVKPADLPAVGDRARADFLRGELDLELVLEAQDREVLGLDRPPRVVGPVIQQPE